MDGLSAFSPMCRHPRALMHNGWCPICDDIQTRRNEAYKVEWYEQVNERLAAIEAALKLPAPKKLLRPTDKRQ